MNRLIWIMPVFFLAVGLTGHTEASPGPKDQDGCHTCVGAGCKKWGLWDGEFHCHATNLYGDTVDQDKMKLRIGCYAIENKHLVKITLRMFDNANNRLLADDADRELVLEPYAIGRDSNGRLTIYGYKLTGESEPKGWKAVPITDALHFKVLEQTFAEPREGYSTGGLTELICQFSSETKANADEPKGEPTEVKQEVQAEKQEEVQQAQEDGLKQEEQVEESKSKEVTPESVPEVKEILQETPAP